MELEQGMNVLPDGTLMEALADLQTRLDTQTMLIYVLLGIAFLSLVIAFAALKKGGKRPAAQPTASAQTAGASAPSDDQAVVAAITAAISCILSQENKGGSAGNSDFVVRRIRRV